MANDEEKEVFRVLRAAQDKYTYFLLAASGAGIALAVNQTRDATVAWVLLPLGLGVLSWGLSFFCGCRQLAYVNSTLHANSELLRVQAGRHPQAGTHPQVIAAASEGIIKAIETNSECANSYANWQFRLLILGAILYVVWHALGIYLRSFD